MTYVYSHIPGQISLPNYIDNLPPVGDVVAYDPGMWAKLESYQYNEAMVANHAHMPNPYQPNNAAHADTVFGELDRLQWLKGILVEASWGKIETSPGVFNWTWIDFVINTVRGLQRLTGQNKRVMLLINLRHVAQLTNIQNFLPADLCTQNMAVNGGYYKDPTSFPPSQTNPIVNAKKYNNAWCYAEPDPSVPGSPVQPRGYNFNLYKFTQAAGSSTLKTRFYAFIDAMQAKYGNDPVFGGITTTESSIGNPFVAFEAGNGRNQNYDGRREIVKYIKSVFTKRIVAEAVNFDKTYYHDMTDAGATNGLIANKLSFTTPNFHLGTNMNLGNINSVIRGKVPIVMQVQGLDMRTITGNRPQYYNWPTNPTQILSGDGINWNDPPTAQWLFDRIKYYNANYCIIQRNYDTSFSAGQQNWPKWKTFMNAGPHANDQYGGMDQTRPQNVG